MNLIDRDKLLKTIPSEEMVARMAVMSAPTVDVRPTLREKALMLLVTWAEQCGFGYDNFPEEYEMYKDEIEGMGYIDGMIYIAERVVEHEAD